MNGSGKPRNRHWIFWTAPLAALVLGGCLFGGDDKKTPENVPLDACVDVPESERLEADALVASANRLMVDDMDYWFGESDSWDQVKGRNPQAALTLYNQALVVAPGHCQAVFGKAMASAGMLTQDPKMDEFIRKVDGMDDESAPAPKVASMAALMKMSPDRSAPALLKVSAGMKKMDRPTVAEVQDLIETVILPKLDATILALETVMDHEMFAVRFDVDGDSVEIDRSEIGPGLAGLKAAKAWLIVVAGYQWDAALDGEYDWIDTLNRIDGDEFADLRPGQKQALDHLTGLFAQGNPFTRVRPAWKTQVEGIPALLLDAVDDAQRGLHATIAEARLGTGQQFDPWRAGGELDADVDTVDIQHAIELLERSKKYLAGEVPISYDKGTRTLKVDFPKLFEIDGLQSKLPYFKFLPYEEWNDTAGADTSWYTYSFSPNASQEVMKALDLGTRTNGGSGSDYWDLFASYSTYPWDSLVTSGSVRYYSSNGLSIEVASFEPEEGNPCAFTYQKHFDIVGSADDSGIEWEESSSEGRFELAACREGETGKLEFADTYPIYKGPLYFTDAAGNKTLGAEEFQKIKDPEDLAGKIIFRDPTFGGIFPELTNENFWSNVASLENVEDRVIRTCEYDEWGFERSCTTTLPSNPSDLDYLMRSLYWLDDIL